jgi:hypothetical protein
MAPSPRARARPRCVDVRPDSAESVVEARKLAGRRTQPATSHPPSPRRPYQGPQTDNVGRGIPFFIMSKSIDRVGLS